MKKVILLIVAVAMFIALPLGSVLAYQAHNGPTELIYYDEAKAFNGYTLFSPFSSTVTYLIDMEGNVVHWWKQPDGYSIEKHAYLLKNGNLLWRIKKSGERIHQEVDWDGNVVWEFQDTREGYTAHHDFHRIWNPKLNAYTTIFISQKAITHEEAIAAGCDPAKRANYTSAPDGIVEVDMDGNIVWEWFMFDHAIQDMFPGIVETYGVVADHPGKMDLNYGNGVRGDWIHFNSLHYNQELDHIAANGRHFSEFYVIDHGATFIPGDPEASIALAAGPAGDFIFRWGTPDVYDQGEGATYIEQQGSSGHQQMWFSHDIQWIEEGLPGAGHFLIYDNGADRVGAGSTQSSVIEIDPYDPEQPGVYIPQPEAGYTSVKVGRATRLVSNQIVWQYMSSNPCSFYARHISGMGRVPNGNTVVCAGTWGHFFEVTQDKEIVWEYINPVTRDGVVTVLKDGVSNSVFRCHRYGPDHPAFAGKDLTPIGTMTGRIPGTVDVYPEAVPITGWGIPPGTVSEAGAAVEAGEAGEGGY